MTICGGYTYRLRAASPMPTSDAGQFVLHSFMAEGQDQTTDTCTDVSSIPASASFQGQGAGLVSANFTRLVAAGQLYRSVIADGVKYIEELE